MCCRCCGVTQQKIWVFGLGILSIVSGLVFVIWWPSWIEGKLYDSLPLTPCSRTFDKWHVTPLPIYVHMYLFNWTNPEQVRTAGVKPHFEQVGPYVYREERLKEDITWHSNKTVSFKAQRYWYFEPKMSGGKLDDAVTAPHIPSIAASNVVRDDNIIVKTFFNRELNRHGGALYQTHTAGEWLFDGFFDEFLDYAMKLNSSMSPKIESNEFAYYLNRNGSKDFEGIFTIHTGQGDLSEMGEIKLWNGKNHTGFYEGECGRLNGSTSDLFAPKRGRDEYITVYITDSCRIINLVPTPGNVVVEGIKGIKYETNPDTYDNGDLNPDMKCYCPVNRQPDNCPKTGATDLGPCADGAPMYLSHGHFMYADESYANTITGMYPDYKEHSFFITIEPKLGVPLEVQAVVQVNLHIQSDNDITILRGIPNFYAPLFMMSSKVKLNKELAGEVKLALNLPTIGKDIGIAFLCLGSVLIIVGIVLTVTHNWRGQRKIMNYEQESERED